MSALIRPLPSINGELQSMAFLQEWLHLREGEDYQSSSVELPYLKSAGARSCFESLEGHQDREIYSANVNAVHCQNMNEMNGVRRRHLLDS